MVDIYALYNDGFGNNVKLLAFHFDFSSWVIGRLPWVSPGYPRGIRVSEREIERARANVLSTSVGDCCLQQQLSGFYREDRAIKYYVPNKCFTNHYF